MNCTTSDLNRRTDLPTGWVWFEIGSVLLYATGLGASIVIAFTELGVGG